MGRDLTPGSPAAPLPKLEQIPQTVAAVADYEELARARLTDQAYAYLAGGAADEVTLRENSAAFARTKLRTRVLQDLSRGHTRLELFGYEHRCPILVAPVAYQRLFHPDSEIATAYGAAAAAVGVVVSTQASTSLEEIARYAPEQRWFQLYIQPDRDFTHRLVQRAEKAGYRTLVVTVDAPVTLRNREQRAGFALPPGVAAVNLEGMRTPAMPEQADDDVVLFGGSLLAAAPVWRDIAWLKSLTTLPVIVKGVMTPEDAIQALSAGADGIIVSNHGGRTLDTQPATVDVLPAITAAVGGSVPVLLDGGIRRGTDVLKAIALGARAVLVGRPCMFALATAGAAGVCHALRILRAEFEVAMALTGRATLTDIDPSVIWRESHLRADGSG